MEKKLSSLVEEMEYFYKDKSFGRGYKIIPYEIKKASKTTFFARFPYFINIFLGLIFVYVIWYIVQDIFKNRKALKQEE